MARRPITTLTDTQWTALATYRDDWYRIGSATGATNREATQATITAMYAAIGHAPPHFLWLESPASALLTSRLFHGQLGGQLWEQLWDQLGDQLREQLWDQLWDQLGEQLGEQLEEQLRSQLRDQLRDQLWDQLGGQLWGQLRDQLGEQLRDQLWDQLGGQLWDQLWEQLEEQLRSQLRDQLREQLWGQLGEQLWGQLGGQLRDQLGEQLRDQLRKIFWGQHASPWIAYYQWMPTIGVRYPAPATQRLGWWSTLATACGWWWPHTGVCLVADRPVSLSVDSQRRLHCTTGPAMAFADGYQLWAAHGVRVTQQIIESPSTLTLPMILSERNAERRRVMIEQWGWDRYLDESHADLRDVDTEPAGAEGLRGLYRCHDGQGGSMQVLVCSCASTGKTFSLEVPPAIETCQQAAAWLANGDLSHLLVRT